MTPDNSFLEESPLTSDWSAESASLEFCRQFESSFWPSSEEQVEVSPEGLSVSVFIKIGSKVDSEAGSGVGSGVGPEIGPEIGSEVGSEVGADFGSEVGSEVAPDFGTEADCEVGPEVATVDGSVGVVGVEPVSKRFIRCCYRLLLELDIKNRQDSRQHIKILNKNARFRANYEELSVLHDSPLNMLQITDNNNNCFHLSLTPRDLYKCAAAYNKILRHHNKADISSL